MNDDYIIQEVRTIREQLAAQHAYDVRALFAAARERQQESGRKVVKLEPKPLEAVQAQPDGSQGVEPAGGPPPATGGPGA